MGAVVVKLPGSSAIVCGGRLWDKEIVGKIATEYQLAEQDVEAKDERVGSFIERVVELLRRTT